MLIRIKILIFYFDMKKLKFVIVIPARFKSSRFPGKPLALIKGKPMIYHVWRQCIKAVNKKNIFIATDEIRIKNICLKYSMNLSNDFIEM